MDIQIKNTYVTENNETTCGDIGVTVDEWYELLNDKESTGYHHALLCFMRAPEHAGTCTLVAKKNNVQPQYLNAKVTAFAKWAQKKLMRIRVYDEDGNEKYWPIVIEKGWQDHTGFVWQLRKEVVAALRQILMDDLIKEFVRGSKDSVFCGYEEIYKWELLKQTTDADTLDIIKATRHAINLVDMPRVLPVVNAILQNRTPDFVACVNKLFDESLALNERIEKFHMEMKVLCPAEFKCSANDERTASFLLTLKYPEKYVFYMDSIYQSICRYFGIETKKPRQKFEHYLQILQGFTHLYGERIHELIKNETDVFDVNPPMLGLQTLFWCLMDYMDNQTSNAMLFTWIPFYKEFAEKLLEFKDDRAKLLNLIYQNIDELSAGYLHDSKDKNDKLDDIDPFTVFGLFNRGISHERRLKTARFFKQHLDLQTAVPQDFEGVPVLNNQKSIFFGYREHRQPDDIENLWSLFAKVVQDEDCEQEYNQVITQFSIRINITMALYWIRPDRFLAFDRTNRVYMRGKYDIELPDKAIEYQDYMQILEDIKSRMEADEIEEQSFHEISASAYKYMGEDDLEDVNDEDEEEDDTDCNWYSDIVQTWKRQKNIILGGAPGTGKTYELPEYIVRLCLPEFKANQATREELMAKYNELKQNKRVAFTTFHQSMDYEDWMEGLRPVVTGNQVSYEVEDGIFKTLCENASRPIVTNDTTGISKDAVVWKVSLAGTGDNEVRTDCMKNNYIRIGWDFYGSEINDETDWSKGNGEGKFILDAFINKMQIGDIVMSCYSNKMIDAIGVVTGEYEWLDNMPHYKRARRVKWLKKDLREDIVELNEGKTLTLGTVYRLNSISLDKVKTLLDKYKADSTLKKNTLPYVMVIDELNRGNVSKIFGELITLLEADKRKGMPDEESVYLPYTKKPFQVPDNVYLIATMNTADRSLGSLDYAVRRRFAFIPNRPYIPDNVKMDEELFAKVSSLFVKNFDEYKDSGYDQSLKLERADTLAEDINPDDVWVGQSYFIYRNKADLNDKVQYGLIPLLEEYIRDGVLLPEAQEIVDELKEIADE